MAVYGKKLLDNEGNTILPKTRSNLVYMSDDETVEDKINGIINGTIQVKEAENAEKAWSADRLIGRTAVYSGDGHWYLHNIEGDEQLENCVPYYYAMKSKFLFPTRYSDGLNIFGSSVSLEEYAENNVFFWDGQKQKVVYPKGRDDTKFPVSGGSFTGPCACSNVMTGGYFRECDVQNSSGTSVASISLLFRRN